MLEMKSFKSMLSSAETESTSTTASPGKASRGAFQNMSTFDPYDNYKKSRPQVSPSGGADSSAAVQQVNITEE